MSEDTPTPTVEEPLVQLLNDSDPEIISDRYVILNTLGEGGMGKVYLAEDNAIKRNVAVKILRFEDSPGLVSRFQQEAKALAKLNHPGIVTAFDFGLIEGKDPYLVMDYIEGRTLDQLLSRKGTLRLKEFRSVFSQITKCLQYAHDQGIVHRDLKPSNIIVRRSKGKIEAFILDFGISKILLDEDSQYLTKTGQIVGSPKYASPEQINSAPIDTRSDIYALGCVMYESLTGSPPFEGESVMETLRMHLEEEPRSLFECSGENYSDSLESLISSTLKKNKEDRIQSMDLLNKAIEENELEVAEEIIEIEGGRSNELLVPLIVLAVIMVALAFFAFNPTLFSKSADSQNKETKSSKQIVKKKTVERVKWIETKIESTRGIFRPNRYPTAKDLAVLKGMHGSHLVGLNLDGYKINKDSLVWIRDNNIKYLVFRNTKFADEDYGYLENLKSTVGLYLGGETIIGGVRYDDRFLKPLAKLPNLENLSLKDSKVSNSGAKLFKSFPKLKYLDLTGNLLTDEGVKYICQSKKLTLLRISGMPGVTEESIQYLKTTNITNLFMLNTSIDGNDLKLFKLLPKVKSLGIGNLDLSLSAEQIRSLNGGNFSILYFSNVTFPKGALDGFVSFKGLKELHFRSCYGVDENLFYKLDKQLPNCRLFNLQPVQMLDWVQTFEK